MAKLAEHAEEQQRIAIAEPAPTYIPACPGAGKTHVITSRHLTSPKQLLRGGRALISFTRVARDQMAKRCLAAGRTDLTQAPHFIGTLDSFLWEFLVRPKASSEPVPRLLDSWARVKAPIEQVDVALELSRFPLTIEIQQKLPVDAIAWDALDYDTSRLFAESQLSRRWWQKRVLAARNIWWWQGYHTGHEARIRALKNLQQDQAETLLAPLRSRFSEIIVDEAQDCSAADLAILERLHDAGLPIILVADPDQAIYSWRGADPTSLHRLTGKLTASPVPLTGNRRSTPTICRLANTLRAGNRAPDTAVIRQDDIPVGLLPIEFATSGGKHRHSPSGANATDVFLKQAAILGISPAESLVTTFRHAHLPARRREPRNSNAITALAWAHAAIHSPDVSVPDLIRATTIGGRALLSYWFPDTQGSIERVCNAHNLPAEKLNRSAYAFLHSLPQPHQDWAKDVWRATKTWPAPAGAAPAQGKGRLAGRPTIARKTTAGSGVRTAVIHQIKGDEADAVLVLLPQENSVQRWIDGNPSTDETLRVWYVAVTRARRLLVLGTRAEETQAFADHLTTHQIPHKIL